MSLRLSVLALGTIGILSMAEQLMDRIHVQL